MDNLPADDEAGRTLTEKWTTNGRLRQALRHEPHGTRTAVLKSFRRLK